MDREPQEPKTDNITIPPCYGLVTEISSLFAKCGLSFDIPELRGYPLKPVSFEE